MVKGVLLEIKNQKKIAKSQDVLVREHSNAGTVVHTIYKFTETEEFSGMTSEYAKLREHIEEGMRPVKSNEWFIKIHWNKEPPKLAHLIDEDGLEFWNDSGSRALCGRVRWTKTAHLKRVTTHPHGEYYKCSWCLRELARIVKSRLEGPSLTFNGFEIIVDEKFSNNMATAIMKKMKDSNSLTIDEDTIRVTKDLLEKLK